MVENIGKTAEYISIIGVVVDIFYRMVSIEDSMQK